MRKLFVKTYGCQMNMYDSARMVDILKPLGYVQQETPEGADMIIVNTCHIREKAEQKLYSDLGRYRPHKEAKSDAILAVAGCVAQAEGEEITRKAPYVDIVFGPQAYHRLPEMIAKAHRQAQKEHVLDIDFPVESKFDHLPAPSAEGLGSAFLSVQEGCDKFCTFCVVPYTRGVESSRPVKDVLRDARHLVAQGVKEITLLGQNVNAYHGETESGVECSLGDLLFELAEIDGLERIRYTTSHPKDMHERLYEAHRDLPKLMPYLHLPVQAGSDRVLKAMNRSHTASEYKDIIAKLRAYRPDISLSSDFIVGFPGETDKDFAETIDLVREVTYASAYSFKYSIRPGTPGALMENQIEERVKDERLAVLQELLREQQLAFNEQCAGQCFAVLFEKPGKHAGQLVGKSPYLQSVHVEANERLLGHIVEVDITAGFQNSLTGRVTLI